MPKIDKIEYMKRIFAIQGWIIEGVQSSLIVRQIITSGWTNAKKDKDQQRSAERMLKCARDLWTEVPEAELDQKRRIKVDELKQLKRTLKDQFKGTPAGIRAITSVEKEIIMLEGLRKPAKVELSGKDGQPIKTEGTHIILYLPDNGRDQNN